MPLANIYNIMAKGLVIGIQLIAWVWILTLPLTGSGQSISLFFEDNSIYLRGCGNSVR